VVDDGVVIVIYTFFFSLHVDLAAAAAAVLSMYLSPVRLTMRGEACCCCSKIFQPCVWILSLEAIVARNSTLTVSFPDVLSPKSKAVTSSFRGPA
jgi:hypothetical protein